MSTSVSTFSRIVRSRDGIARLIAGGVLVAGVGVGQTLAQLSPPPANDLCENAQVVTAPGVISATSDWSTGVDLSPFGLQCGFQDTADVWYFVPGGASPRQFFVEATTQVDYLTLNVAAFTACPTFNGEHIIACYTMPSLIVFLAPAGQDVLVRVSADDNLSGSFDLDLRWADIVTPLPGDSCDSPLTIAPGGTASGNLAGYSGSDVSSCTGPNFDGADVWYRLTIGSGQAGNYVINTQGSLIDTVLSVFSACPTVNGEHEIACDDDVRPIRDALNRPAVFTSEIGVLLAEGEYLIRVSSFADQPGNYQLSVSGRQEPIVGDACENAIPLEADVEVTGSTGGLTGFNLGGGCAINDRTDAWFVFTPTRTGVYTPAVSTASGVLFPVVRLFDACGGTQLRCGYSNTASSELAYNLIAGEDYYVRIAGYNSLAGAFRLTMNAPPVNDFCSGAIELPIVQTQPLHASVSGSTANAYNIWQEGDFNFQGVWYSFTAPSSGWYRVSTEGSVLLDTRLVVVDACQASTPGSGRNVLASNDNITFGGTQPNRWSRVDVQLAAGQTCFIEVSTGDNAEFQGTREFVLNVTQTAVPAPVLNDTCETALSISNGFSLVQDARGSTIDLNVPNCYYTGYPINPLQPAEAASYGVWYVYEAVGNGIATFTQTGQSATSIRVLRGLCGEQGGTIGLDRNSYACGTSSVSWDAVDGERYFILVHTSAARIYDGALPIGSYGVQPSSPYVVSMSVAEKSGSCCVGTACAINTKAGCLQQGGEYLGDSSTCIKPSGVNQVRTAIAEPVDQFGSADTSVDVSVTGVQGTVSSVEVHVDIEHYRAGNLSLMLRSPSGTTATLAGRVVVPNVTNCWQYTYYFLNGVYVFADSGVQDFRQGVHTTALHPEYTVDGGTYGAWDCEGGRVSLNGVFAGQSASGVWTLIARDHSSFADSGTIRAVRLLINGGSGDACAPACRADFNSAGGVTVQDIFDFLAAWFAGSPSADFNSVGGVTVQDIFDFLSAWFAGC